MLIPWNMEDSTMTTRVSSTKMVTGWGSLFPARSMRPRMPERFSIFSFAMGGNSLHAEEGKIYVGTNGGLSVRRR